MIINKLVCQMKQKHSHSISLQVMKAVVDQFAKASKGDISDKDVERAK